MSDAIVRLNAALEGRYRLERELGAGGMATVYLAEDLKHDRKVAIKVLKPELAAVLGADRFVQEIKTTAQLQHPHILPLHDSGTADGFLFYVMPYIEGETLRDKLDRETQLGIDEAVRITREVADALDYAHRNGIIHRDIKPENILLHDGRPMVADFGIALAVSAAAGGRMTETGTSVGTPHYMSPEQATGDKQITGRADIYSLASVLYEMLTGEPPHSGASAQAVIMKIIADTPRLVSELRKSVPPNVAAAVMHGLEKLPADRFDSARAFADALSNPMYLGTRHGASMIAGAATPWYRSPVFYGALGVSLGALAVLAWSQASGRAAVGGPVARAELDVVSRSDSGVFLNVHDVDISPDGSMIVFGVHESSSGVQIDRLYLRRLDDRQARVVPGTEGGQEPVFSPDGQAIVYRTEEGEVRRIPVAGGVSEAVVRLPRQREDFDFRWGMDGYLYYSGPRLGRVSLTGGAPEVILESSARNPVPLPGGRHVLYTPSGEDSDSVRVVDLRTRETRTVGARAAWARYLATGHLLLGTSDALRAVAFDARRLTVRGEPFVVMDSAVANGTVESFAIADNGTAVYTARSYEGGGYTSALALVDLAGQERRLPLPAGIYWDPSFSPDGRRIAFVAGASRDMLIVHDLVLGTTTRIVTPQGGTHDPLWTPAGALIYLDRHFQTRQVLVSIQPDGGGGPDTLYAGENFPHPNSISPDGRRLLLQTNTLGKGWDLSVASMDGRPLQVTDYLNADWYEGMGRISPDGNWVAFSSGELAATAAEAGTRVVVTTFPEPGRRIVVSDTDASEARWAPDGRTIYYVRPGGTLVAATVQTTPEFTVTARRDLFNPGGISGYDVHPDGRQFVFVTPLAVTPDDLNARPRLLGPRPVLVVNWLAEFRRKAEGASR